MLRYQPRLRVRSVIFFVIALLAASGTSWAQIILRVDGDAGSLPPPIGSADGSQWGELSFKFLQDALAEAGSLPPGVAVEIWTAASTDPYRPDQSAANEAGSLNPLATFSLQSNVQIYGGFNGTEIDRSERDPVVNVTVLSGNYLAGGAAGSPPNCPNPAGGDCLTATPDEPGCQIEACCTVVCDALPFCCQDIPGQRWIDACVTFAEKQVECTQTPMAAFHVVTADGVDLTSRLDGVTIAGGIADGMDINARGGGLLVVEATPMVVRCTFQENSAADGGAVRIEGTGSNPRFVNCRFVANSADGFGGAVITERGGLFVNCLFLANSAGAWRHRKHRCRSSFRRRSRR